MQKQAFMLFVCLCTTAIPSNAMHSPKKEAASPDQLVAFVISKSPVLQQDSSSTQILKNNALLYTEYLASHPISCEFSNNQYCSYTTAQNCFKAKIVAEVLLEKTKSFCADFKEKKYE